MNIAIGDWTASLIKVPWERAVVLTAFAGTRRRVGR